MKETKSFNLLKCMICLLAAAFLAACSSSSQKSTLISLTVTGAAAVNSGDSASYVATAAFSNGTTRTVTASSNWSANSSVATISNSGVLSAAQILTNQTITVAASYTSGGITKNGSRIVTIIAPGGIPNSTSSNSTSRNLPGSAPASAVIEQQIITLPGYNILAMNDLGMHCGDLDHRVVSILPPFNVLHALVIKRGTSTASPMILKSNNVRAVYSAASNPNDPALQNPATASVYKTNFWDTNLPTGNSLAFDAYNSFYPPNILNSSVMTYDAGLPVPDLELLYPLSGASVLDAVQQVMPGGVGAYTANVPQLFNLFNINYPFFITFPFGYRVSNINWFAADGIPEAPFDDFGRPNAFPLMRVQAVTANTTLTGQTGQTLATVDTVTPVSAEANCYLCHTSSVDGGNGQAACLPGLDAGCATAGSLRSFSSFTVVRASQDPASGSVPAIVSREWAADKNILALHDAVNATNLSNAAGPVVCQKCHYSPALDLAHLGPLGPSDAAANGREQTTHHSNSRALHSYHSQFTDLFAAMVPPNNPLRTSGGVPVINAYVQTTLNNSCYRCHPGLQTKCLRGAMYNGGLICQDCHGNLQQVGNDFSGNFSAATPFPGGANLSLRVPWAHEPACGSCHSGDAMSNLGNDLNVIKSADGIRLIQVYRTNDATATPIVPTNKRFAEETAPGGARILYRLSKGHSGIACEACHGSTHAEWPVQPENGIYNANDNIAATQIQGHTGKIMECTACHAEGSLPVSLGGPHSMHPVNDANFVRNHEDLAENSSVQCKACHGQTGQGTVLSKAAANRTLAGRSIAKGQLISCGTCHDNPLSGGGNLVVAAYSAAESRAVSGRTSNANPLAGTAAMTNANYGINAGSMMAYRVGNNSSQSNARFRPAFMERGGFRSKTMRCTACHKYPF